MLGAGGRAGGSKGQPSRCRELLDQGRMPSPSALSHIAPEWRSPVSPHHGHTCTPWGQPPEQLHASPSTLFSISTGFLSKIKLGHRCSPSSFAHLPLQYPKIFFVAILPPAAHPKVPHSTTGLLLPSWSQPGPTRRATRVLAKHPSSTQDRGLLNPQNSQRKKHPTTTLQPPNTLSANRWLREPQQEPTT